MPLSVLAPFHFYPFPFRILSVFMTLFVFVYAPFRFDKKKIMPLSFRPLSFMRLSGLTKNLLCLFPFCLFPFVPFPYRPVSISSPFRNDGKCRIPLCQLFAICLVCSGTICCFKGIGEKNDMVQIYLAHVCVSLYKFCPTMLETLPNFMYASANVMTQQQQQQQVQPDVEHYNKPEIHRKGEKL
jgi:hypothetical protein